MTHAMQSVVLVARVTLSLVCAMAIKGRPVQFSLWRLLVGITLVAIVIGIFRVSPSTVLALVFSIGFAVTSARALFWIDGHAKQSESDVRYKALMISAMAAYVLLLIATVTLVMLATSTNG